MKTYPKLYARSGTGATLVWWMEQDNDKYRCSHGQWDGKIVTDAFTIALPKNTGKINATNGEQQATIEINSKYKKQLKSGYFEDVKKIDNNNFFQPMLAKNFKDRLNKIVYPVIVDRKYNGGRCIAQKTGLFTRTGEQYVSVPHIWDSIYPLFEEFPNLILDGELYNHEYRFNLNEIMKLIRKTVHITDEDFQNSLNKINFYVYDGFGFEMYGRNISAETELTERRIGLKYLLRSFSFIKLVEGEKATSEQEVYSIYKEYLDQGYEGAIVRLNKGYECKRSANLLKLKPEMDDEAIIIDIRSGEGNWTGAGKIITLKWKDKTFDATFKGTFEDSVKFLIEKDKWIGQTVTFLYNDLTGLGIPNFARMDYNNCIKK